MHEPFRESVKIVALKQPGGCSRSCGVFRMGGIGVQRGDVEQNNHKLSIKCRKPEYWRNVLALKAPVELQSRAAMWLVLCWQV